MIALRTRGFTLVEIMVVVGVIGLLSSVILFSVSSARGKARDATRLVDIEQVHLAVQLYAEAEGAYPDSSGDFTFAGGLTNLVPTFLPALPTDPQPNPAGVPGQYRYLKVNSGYMLIVATIEGKAGVSHCYVTNDTFSMADLPSQISNQYGTPGTASDFVPCSSL